MADDNADLIQAYLREREGYVAAGKTDRAKQVTDELKKLGYKEPAASKGKSDA